jgi:hypothetical protein
MGIAQMAGEKNRIFIRLAFKERQDLSLPFPPWKDEVELGPVLEALILGQIRQQSGVRGRCP